MVINSILQYSVTPVLHSSLLPLRQRSRYGPRLPAGLAEQLDHLPIERQDIVGLAAGDEPLVDHCFLINPLSAGVAQIGLQRRPRGDAPPRVPHRLR